MQPDLSVPGYDEPVYEIPESEVDELEEHGIRYDILGRGSGSVRVKIEEGEPVYLTPMLDGTIRVQIQPVPGGKERWREIDT